MSTPAPTVHTIIAGIPINVTCGGCDDTLRIEVLIEYVYQPPEGSDTLATLTRKSAVMVDSEGPDPTHAQVLDFAQEWLDGDGYELACAEAERRGATHSTDISALSEGR